MQDKCFLNLDHISFQPDGVDRRILDDISFSIDKGDFIILLGGNGSGKSSLLKVIAGTYPIKEGTLFSKAKNICTVTQDVNHLLCLDMTIFENYLLRKPSKFFFFKNAKKIRNQFQLYIKDFNENLCEKLDTKVRSLSGGEKQSLAISLTLLADPDLLLLDEHTAALDPKTATSIMDLTKKTVERRGITCIMTTHNLQHAISYGNKLFNLQNGRLNYSCESLEKKNLKTNFLLQYCYD